MKIFLGFFAALISFILLFLTINTLNSSKVPTAVTIPGPSVNPIPSVQEVKINSDKKTEPSPRSSSLFSGGICGTVNYYPNNFGQNQQQSTSGFSTKINIYQNSQLITTTKSDDNGNFEVKLRPGTYTLITEQFGVTQNVEIKDEGCTKTIIDITPP